MVGSFFSVKSVSGGTEWFPASFRLYALTMPADRLCPINFGRWGESRVVLVLERCSEVS